MAKKVEEKVVVAVPAEAEAAISELDKTDFSGESEEKVEFRRIIASFRKERGEEAYERNKEEYETILGKLNNPDFHY